MPGRAAGSAGCIRLGREALRLQLLLGAGRRSAVYSWTRNPWVSSQAVSLLRQAPGWPGDAEVDEAPTRPLKFRAQESGFGQRELWGAGATSLVSSLGGPL